MKTVFIKNFGCKVNAFDGQVLTDIFLKEGFALAETYKAADIVVLNTCAVTKNAEKEVLYVAKRIKRETPHTLVAMTGCYAKIAEKDLAENNLFDLIVPHEKKGQLPKIVKDYMKIGIRDLNRKEGQSLLSQEPVFFGASCSTNTRAFIKVQDGCDSYCSYCIVPFARGHSVSVPLESVLCEVRRQIARGTKEVVLTGVHIGNYGKDIGDGKTLNLSMLMREIFSIEGFFRVRLSSLEINDMTDDLMQCLALHRDMFCDHLHLPLQSGSSRILKLMNRHYTPEDFLAVVNKFRTVFPRASIGSDVIVGFPGEEAEDFELTLKSLTDVDIAYCHVFPFSSRPMTKAAEMPKKVASPIIKHRAKVLRDFGEERLNAYTRSFLGQTMEVLWEGDRDEEERPLGKTRNYLTVAYEGEGAPEKGTLNLVYLKQLSKDGNIIGRTPREF